VSAPGPASFEAVVKRYRVWILAMVLRLGAATGDVEDLTQEVLLAAYRGLDRYDPRRPLKPWLKTIASRIVRDHLALGRHGEERLDDDPPYADPFQDPERTSEAARGASVLHELLQQLEPDVRVVLELAELHELTYPEIAERLGITESTVQARLRRARQGFQQAFERWRTAEQRRMAMARYCSASPIVTSPLRAPTQERARQAEGPAAAAPALRKRRGRPTTKLRRRAPVERLIAEMVVLEERAHELLETRLKPSQRALAWGLVRALMAARLSYRHAQAQNARLYVLFKDQPEQMPVLLVAPEASAKVVDLTAYRLRRQLASG